MLLVVEADGRLVALDCEQIPKPTTLPARLLEAARAREARPVVELNVGKRVVHFVELERVLARGARGRDG